MKNNPLRLIKIGIILCYNIFLKFQEERNESKGSLFQKV